MTVKVFRLISSENIMAEVVNDDKNKGAVILKNPVTYLVSSEYGIIMNDWMAMTSGEEVIIYRDHIISELGEANELSEYYYTSYLNKSKSVNKAAIDSFKEMSKEELEGSVKLETKSNPDIEYEKSILSRASKDDKKTIH